MQACRARRRAVSFQPMTDWELPGQIAWRLFVSYTGKDLDEHARVVAEVARRQQRWIVDDHIDWPVTGRPSVNECVRHVQRADALLALCGERKGWTPAPAKGGDGERSICHLEWDAAAELPRAGLLGGEGEAWKEPADTAPPPLRTALAATAGAGSPTNLFTADPQSVTDIAGRALAELDRQISERYDQARREAAAAQALRPPYVPLDYHQDYDLCRPEYGVVPFLHRRRELAEDIAWCRTDLALALLLRHGEGGAGKTRLAAELCERMSRRGWIAGFLRDGADPAHIEPALAAARPVLIAVDYAENRVPQVAALLARVKERSREYAVRVLLLARGAGDWWQRTLPESSAVAEQLVGSTVATVVRELAAIAVDPSRRAPLFRDAIDAFARVLELEPPSGVPPLDDEAFASALIVVVAALVAVRDGVEAVTAASQDPASTQRLLLQTLLRREARRWRQSAPKIDGEVPGTDVLRRVVAVATVAPVPAEDDAPEDRAAALLAAVPDLESEAARRRMARSAKGLHAGPAWWNPLQPDLLGETLAVDTFMEAPSMLDAIAANEAGEVRHRLLTVLTRAARHRSDDAEPLLERVLTSDLEAWIPPAMDVALETGAPMGRVLAAAVGRAATGEVAKRLSSVLPHFSVELIAATAANAAVLTDHYRRLAEANPDRYLPDLAQSLNNQASDLDELGRLGDALSANSEAIEIWRRLAEANPDRYLPDLATSLNNQSVYLDGLGQPAEALDAITEAIGIRRRLADANPDRYLPDLAQSLNNQAICLDGLGRPAEALDAITAAADAFRRLAEANPDRYLPDLATSLWVRSDSKAPSDAEGAVADLAEALDGLVPILSNAPPPTVQLARYLADLYEERCTGAGVEADGALLARVADALGETRP